MKKIIMLLLAFCLVSPCTFADTSKDLRKAMKKQKTEKIKQFKKEKWTIFGSTNTLDVALLDHYNKLETMGGAAHEMVGLASGFKSKNIGKQTAYNNACFSYAQEVGSDLQGRVASDLRGGTSEDNQLEFDNFYAAFERNVQKEIRGEMKESFSVIHDNGDGTFDLQTFFIIDEEGASRARMKALEAAMEESDIAKRHAEKISDFVKGK